METAEAHYLHRTFFGHDAPADVADLYAAAAQLCCTGDDSLLPKLMELEADAEAVELALRTRGGSGVLGKKIRILFYIVEVRPEYAGYFFGCQESPGSALLGLGAALLRTGLKYVKGEYLVRRHRLV